MATAKTTRAAPRFELWNLQFPREVHAIQFVQLGVQAPSPEAAAEAAKALGPLLSLEDGPNELSRGLFIDDRDVANVTYIAYWFDPAAHERWSAQPAVRAFWAGVPTHGPLGYWRESARVPVEFLDTLYTPHDPVQFQQTGVAQHGSMNICQMHDYWGAVRDRMPAAVEDQLAPDFASYEPYRGDTRGRRVSMSPPGNVCMARHHEDWRNSPLFGEIYRQNVAGVKDAGTRHLGKHPELGCITSRAIDGQGLDGAAIGRADAVAWFLSLDNLLAWARSDPSHLAIYSAFFKAATQVQEGQVWDVPMWHEVFVVPRGNLQVEYVNCHNRTGFLTLLEHPALTGQAAVA